MECEFLKTNKGGDLLIVDNYKFLFRSNMPQGRRFRCTGCSIALLCDHDKRVTRTDGTLEFPIHKHHNNFLEIKLIRLKNKCKEKIKKNVSTKVRTAYNESLKEQLEDSDHLPCFYRVKSVLCKTKSKLLPPQPTTRRDFQIPDLYFSCLKGNQFLQINNGRWFLLRKASLFNRSDSKWLKTDFDAPLNKRY